MSKKWVYFFRADAVLMDKTGFKLDRVLTTFSSSLEMSFPVDSSDRFSEIEEFIKKACLEDMATRPNCSHDVEIQIRSLSLLYNPMWAVSDAGSMKTMIGIEREEYEK